ncbi:cobyric acid synthase [Natronospora cellulosivora (SeqCode)]
MAKNIMIQGTASSVGKSLLTAALCRILKDQGYKVAPYKSQNMALNSYITRDGKEIGRAQVVQAEAARIEPTVEMNPILLKPTSDVGSQVIINGEVYANSTAEEYYQIKPKLKKIVKEAYDKLASKFQGIIIEGAGSPAEINLRENDIVNMGLAELVDSPVILVADIDKGGVFASIYGTIMLLEADERERIKGFIINKFRGDIELLKPGIRMIEEKIEKPCLGVVPYMQVKVDDEDSVSSRFDYQEKGNLKIGIVKLPYISNFTDFTPLEMETDISIRYLSSKNDFQDIDLLIIPGSKNTINDMKYILESGINQEIYKMNKMGTPIIGICGGYQILGREIKDPDNIESSINRIIGLSLLDISTTILKKKETKQIKGTLNKALSICEGIEASVISGYEIHMGRSELADNLDYAIELEDRRLDGAINDQGNVFGTYLHGIFENDNFRDSLLNGLRKKKGISNKNEELSYKEFKELEYNKLAKVVSENVEIETIKEIMGF